MKEGIKKKVAKKIPEKYAKAIAESREYMNKKKEHKAEMSNLLKVYKNK